MCATRRKESERSLGEGDDFLLYMFEEDLEMIERWFAKHEATGKQQISESCLYGLLTNTLNPVCHIVCKDGVPAEEYHLIKHLPFENVQDSPLFSLIGYWSFEYFLPEDAKRELEHELNKPVPQRFVFLSVEKDQGYFAYHPFLFKRDKHEEGKVEPLKGQNSYRLPNSSSNDQGQERREKSTGQVSLLRYKFETLTEETSNETCMSPNSTARNNAKPISYASAAKQGNRPCASDQTPANSAFLTSQRETPPHPQERSKEQKGSDVLDYSHTNQWYDTRPADLKSTLDFVKSLADDKKTVNITRDKTTQNMTLEFKHHDYEWLIEFPIDFPSGNVKLKKRLWSNNAMPNIYSIEGMGDIDFFRKQVKSKLLNECMKCSGSHRQFSRSYYSNKRYY